MRRVLLCSGKVAYDLLAAREAEGSDDVAVVRVEQLYPLPSSELVQTLERYPNAAEVVWVQEEPANMGAWQFMAVNLPAELPPEDAVGRQPQGLGQPGRRLGQGARGRAEGPGPSRLRAVVPRSSTVYFTDRGIEELVTRPGRGGGLPRLAG